MAPQSAAQAIINNSYVTCDGLSPVDRSVLPCIENDYWQIYPFKVITSYGHRKITAMSVLAQIELWPLDGHRRRYRHGSVQKRFRSRAALSRDTLVGRLTFRPVHAGAARLLGRAEPDTAKDLSEILDLFRSRGWALIADSGRP